MQMLVEELPLGSEGCLAQNAFLRGNGCTKPYVFPDKARPRTSMIYPCGEDGCETVSCVVGSSADHVRIMG